MIGTEVAHYKILDRLGGGGMGVVYKAEDTRLGRTVALKFLNLELLANDSVRKRFLHEARAASSIDHPNVCPVYEVGEADGRYYMAMSYCEGRSLRDVVHDGPVAPREAFSIAFGVAQGLWAAHRRGIVHRDIKPANVILTDDGFVRIVDFGLALLIGDSRVTTSGVTVGTVAYMSPEQTSDSTVSANTDIWSLGVTLYELLTGRLPFRGDVNAALVYSIVHEPHIPLPDSVPPQCARIVDRCLEKDPATRYPTIEELLVDMVKAAQELGWESSMASATIAPILRERRRRILTRRVATVAAALVLAAGSVYAYRMLHPHTPYVTKVRLAAMPLDNLVGADNDALVDGISDHIARMCRWASRGRSSMWTVLYSAAASAQLSNISEAASTFGVNRVITGNVQRVGNRHQVRLELRDANRNSILREASIPFDIAQPSALLDSVFPVLAKWFDIDAAWTARELPWHTTSPRAARPYLEGLSFFRKGDKSADLADRAASAFETCASLDPSFATANCMAGFAELQVYGKNGDKHLIEQAIQHGRAARKFSPRFTDAGVLLANAFRAQENDDSAEACYRRVLTVEPGNVTACERLGNVYAGQNRLQEAEDCYVRAATENRDYWVAYRILGLFYYRQHRLDDAATAWDHALELAPRDVVTLNNLGAVHYDRGEWPQAQDAFLQSFHVHPDCLSCNNVATTLFLRGDFRAAAKYFELELSPAYCDSADYVGWGNWGSALYWTDDGRSRALSAYRRAISKAESALKAAPDSPDIIADLVDYYAMTDDSTRARAMIARAEPYLEKDEKVMYRVGSAYEKLGERDLALHQLGNAVRHGYPLSAILADPVLRDLVHDLRFDDMVRTQVAADGAEAARNAR